MVEYPFLINITEPAKQQNEKDNSNNICWRMCWDVINMTINKRFISTRLPSLFANYFKKNLQKMYAKSIIWALTWWSPLPDYKSIQKVQIIIWLFCFAKKNVWHHSINFFTLFILFNFFQLKLSQMDNFITGYFKYDLLDTAHSFTCSFWQKTKNNQKD